MNYYFTALSFSFMSNTNPNPNHFRQSLEVTWFRSHGTVGYVCGNGGRLMHA